MGALALAIMAYAAGAVEGVTGVGHDTKLIKAEDAVYHKLPACCKYERIKYDEKEKG